ncbi:hypothetical protein B9Z45_16410, partial [Limnohabitans sp. 2KL-17]|uniref:hypothetical protein n=1 Tax=Limnohabitans sp. 2KL-17 TaxID=1100704 RepID=UPI000DD2390D
LQVGQGEQKTKGISECERKIKKIKTMRGEIALANGVFQQPVSCLDNLVSRRVHMNCANQEGALAGCDTHQAVPWPIKIEKFESKRQAGRRTPHHLTEPLL